MIFSLLQFTILLCIFNIFQTNLPVFKVKESSVRRRYSDFKWLRNELERDSKVTKFKLFYHSHIITTDYIYYIKRLTVVCETKWSETK